MNALVRLLSFAIALVPAVAAASPVDDPIVLIQSTTSTENSGLYDTILPLFEAATGYDARVVAVGTGQALENAARCDGDVALVHARAAEEAFVAAGHGVLRVDVMANDFVIVGPNGDPARIGDAATAADAFGRIAASGAPFASRGDDSGTHQRERALWEAAGLDPAGERAPWLRETGSGMGATLNVAVGLGAYALTDRATWARFENKAEHAILVEGDPALFNQYGALLVNPERCPRVNVAGARAFVDWLLSEEGRSAILSHRIGGETLFTPNGPPAPP